MVPIAEDLPHWKWKHPLIALVPAIAPPMLYAIEKQRECSPLTRG